MKKLIAVLCLLVFVQFTAIYAFSPELMLKSFDLDKASASKDEGIPFSLKTTYSPKLKIDDPLSFAATQGEGSAEEQIKKLKSTRMMNYAGAVAFIGVGAGLVYLFATYDTEGKKTTNQLGETGTHTETNSFAQWGYLLGGLLCGGVSAYLISSAAKNGKAIKEYEAELKAAAAVQR
jgi:hypothetical protein